MSDIQCITNIVILMGSPGYFGHALGLKFWDNSQSRTPKSWDTRPGMIA